MLQLLAAAPGIFLLHCPNGILSCCIGTLCFLQVGSSSQLGATSRPAPAMPGPGFQYW